MVHISSEQVERLTAIRLQTPPDLLYTYGDPQSWNEWVLHNFCLYGEAEEVAHYLDAPTEWIVEAYPNVLTCGAYFRDVEKMITLIQKLDKEDEQFDQFLKEWKLSRDLSAMDYGSYHTARRQSENVLKKYIVSFDSVLSPSGWAYIYSKFGSEFLRSFKDTISGLITRDLITQEHYDIMTLPWRNTFGELTAQDSLPIYIDGYDFSKIIS